MRSCYHTTRVLIPSRTDARSFLDVYQDVHPDKPSASPAYPPSLPPLNF